MDRIIQAITNSCLGCRQEAARGTDSPFPWPERPLEGVENHEHGGARGQDDSKGVSGGSVCAGDTSERALARDRENQLKVHSLKGSLGLMTAGSGRFRLMLRTHQ